MHKHWTGLQWVAACMLLYFKAPHIPCNTSCGICENRAINRFMRRHTHTQCSTQLSSRASLVPRLLHRKTGRSLGVRGYSLALLCENESNPTLVFCSTLHLKTNTQITNTATIHSSCAMATEAGPKKWCEQEVRWETVNSGLIMRCAPTCSH